MAANWLDEIEAHADETVPYYLPRLIQTIRNQDALLVQRAQAIEELELRLFHCEKDRDAARSDRNRFQAMSQCQTHGDSLVCLACEAEEDARPEWARAEVDVEALRQLARTHRVPRDPFAEQLSAAILTLCDALTED